MELFAALIGAGLAVAAPLVPVLRPLAKAVVKGGLAVADATVAVAVVVSQQVDDFVTNTHSTPADKTLVDAEPVTVAVSEESSPGAPAATRPQTTVSVETSADLASSGASSVSVPSLRPVVKAGVKGGLALVDAAKGAANAAVGIAALSAKQLTDLASRVNPEKQAGDIEPTDYAPQVTGVAGASDQTRKDTKPAPDKQSVAQSSGNASSAGSRTVQVQHAAADDLVQISGIGPKVASLLQETGITSFAQLATTSVEHLREMLDRAGARYRVIDPSSWPAQAQTLMDAPRTDQIRAINVDDLEQIIGIGPKIASLLKEAGITNLTELAATNAERLQVILDRGGARYRVIDPTSWPAQAQALLGATK